MAVGTPGGGVLSGAPVVQALALGLALVQLQALLCGHHQVACSRGAPEEAQQASLTFGALQQQMLQYDTVCR